MDYIYRNYTVEYLFDSTCKFSGYGDVAASTGHVENTIIFYQVNPSYTPEDQILEIEEIKSKISFIVENQKGRIIILKLFRNLQNDWQSKTQILLQTIDDFNEIFLKEIQENNPKVKTIDINKFYAATKQPFVDWRFFFISQMIINPKSAQFFRQWFTKQIEVLELKRKKCIVLDCDNTLWGGVVGEDGALGIKIGLDYPGICYKSFQKLLLMLSQKGVILTVCSKNNLKDVQDVWENNPNNLISEKVISSYRINWQDKASNIKSIAEELNIGTDSIVFIDDNPLERGLVKKFLPEIEVPEFPQKPYHLIDFFWELYQKYFDVYEFSNEDLKKTEQYKENFYRNESKKSFENISDYLASLDIQINIQEANIKNLQRISQMTQKTNQFNLTTKRYTEEHLVELLEKGAKIYGANVKDKFGDNGITIVAIVTETSDKFHLDSYLLSCRILGRNIEKITLLKILEKINQNKNKPITAEFIPTQKNALASKFLEEIGFTIKKMTEDGRKFYNFEKNNNIEIENFYTIDFS